MSAGNAILESLSHISGGEAARIYPVYPIFQNSILPRNSPFKKNYSLVSIKKSCKKIIEANRSINNKTQYQLQSLTKIPKGEKPYTGV